MFRCSVSGKYIQVLNLTIFEMTYLGQKNDFVESWHSLTLFEAYFRHSLGALFPCNDFFEFLCYTFACQKFYTFTCCL